MRYRLSMTAAAVVAVALLFGACQPIESSSRVKIEQSSEDGGSVTSVNKVYVVKRGDTLHRIAVRECGSGASVEALAEVNVGRRQPDGTTMKDPDVLQPGWEIVVSCQSVSD